jgi:hypothetical protein
VVIGASAGGSTCDDMMPAQDPYEAVLARARCEHPDMLVHADWYVVRRVPSPPNVTRFALDQPHTGQALCCYEVDGRGLVRLKP